MTLLHIELDIDGTITAEPDFFLGVERRWLESGREVHIVSTRSPEARAETLLKLKQLGVSFTALYLLPYYGVAETLYPHANWIGISATYGSRWTTP